MSMFSPPTPPDPQTGMQYGQQVAQNQQSYNTGSGIQSQAGSMVNQTNPYGSLSYTQTGVGPNGTPIYSASQQYSDPQQGLFNTLQNTQQTAGTQGSNLLSGANYGAQSPSDVIGDATKGNTQAMVQQENSYLQPFFSTQTSQLDTQLRNQGLLPGQPAYDNAMRANQTNQGLTESNFVANVEPQAYSQAVQNYQMPASMGAALAQFGAPGSINSNLTGTPQLNIQPANLVGATSVENTAQQQQYAAQSAQYSALMAGLFGTGTAALKAMAGMPSIPGGGGSMDAAKSAYG